MKRGFVALLALVAVAGAGALVLRRDRRPPPPSPDRLDTLTRERDALQAKWAEVVIVSGEQSLAEAPEADLMIGVPTSLTRSIVEQVVIGVFGQTTLTLENLRVRTAGEVKAKALIAKHTVGEYALEVEIHRVRGTLRAGAPTLSFAGDTVEVTLPVRLVGGEGDADLRFRWDSRGLADLVCGDIDVKRHVESSVVPEDYQVAGTFAIAAVGESIVLRPRFPDLAVRVTVAPSAQAWGMVDAVIRDRSKGCEIALDAIDVREKLQEIIGRGFEVKVPQKIFKPIRLPAGVSQSLRIHDVDVALRARPTGLRMAGDRLWYGADVSVSARRPGPSAGRGPATP